MRPDPLPHARKINKPASRFVLLLAGGHAFVLSDPSEWRRTSQLGNNTRVCVPDQEPSEPSDDECAEKRVFLEYTSIQEYEEGWTNGRRSHAGQQQQQ